MTDWEDFCVAQVGGAAALAGLIFVGLSLNLQKILAIRSLPRRAATALIMLVTVVLVSTIILAPEQPANYVGLEILAVGLISWLWSLWLWVRSIRQEGFGKPIGAWSGPVFSQFALSPFVIAGIAVLLQGFDGLYWLLPGVVLCYIAALLNAWVLLVEINR